MGLLDHGISLIRSGNLPAARDNFETLLETNPENDGLNRFLGRVLVQLGQSKTAANYVNRSIELNSDQPLWCYQDYIKSNYTFSHVGDGTAPLKEGLASILACPQALEDALGIAKIAYPEQLNKGEGVLGRKIMYLAALHRKISFLSPMTGELVYSDKSLSDYSFSFAECGFTLCFFGNWAHPFLSFQMILEESKIILYGLLDAEAKLAPELLDPMTYIGSLAKLMKNTYLYKNEINEYLAKPSVATVLTNEDFPHLGHAIWNGMSSLVPFDNEEIHQKVEHFIPRCSAAGKDVESSCFRALPFDVECTRSNVKENKVDDIIGLPKKVRFEPDALEDAHIYKHNYFKLTLTGNYIYSEISMGLGKHALSVLKKTEVEVIRDFRKRHFPVVTIGLRAGTRQWVNQKAGYLAVMKSIEARFPNVGFVIDGMNKVGKDAHVTHLSIDLDKENAIAASLSVARNNVISVVGREIALSIAWGEIADLVIAPWGAGLAKYKWVNNSKCLILGSQCVLSEKPDLHIYDDEHYMEYARADIFISVKAASNALFGSMDECEAKGKSKNDYYYQDFDCNSEEIASLAINYLSSLVDHENKIKSSALRALR